MKTKKYDFTDILLLAGACVFGALFVTFLCLMISYQMAVFRTSLLYCGAAAIALYIGYFTRNRNMADGGRPATRKKKQPAEQELQKKENEIKKLQQALIDAQNGAGKQSPAQQLKELQTFCNSFPLTLADGYIVNGIHRSEYVPNSYSRWKVYGEDDGQLFSITLLRPDVQKQSELLLMIKGTKSCTELPDLNITADQLPQ